VTSGLQILRATTGRGSSRLFDVRHWQVRAGVFYSLLLLVK
jgi:hypothetical protein